MTTTTVHVGATQEIWDAINADLQQILDDVSCWEGRHAERMCERLETAIKRLNAAVGHEREGYETAIAVGYENDLLRTRLAEVERDAARGRFMITNGCWHRGDEQTHLAVLVPQGSDLSCYAMREAAIDAAMGAQA